MVTLLKHIVLVAPISNPGTGAVFRYNLDAAPYGGCSVSFYNASGTLQTLDIPEQDAGLSFSIDVGVGGIISDTCGFNSNT